MREMFSSPTPLAALALSIIIASVTSSAVPARGWARAPRAPCAVQLGVRVRASVLLDAAATTADLAPAAAEPAAAAPRKRTRRGGRGGSGPGAQRRASADASRAAASSAAAQPASEAGAGEVGALRRAPRGAPTSERARQTQRRSPARRAARAFCDAGCHDIGRHRHRREPAQPAHRSGRMRDGKAARSVRRLRPAPCAQRHAQREELGAAGGCRRRG